MGSPTDPKNLFPPKLDIEYWKEALANLPLNEDQENLSTSLEIRNTTVVTKLYLCKENTVSKHEFLVANLRRKDGRRLHARIERNRGEPGYDEKREIERRERQMNTEDRSGNSESRSTSTSSLVRLGSSSDSCQLRAKADDCVRFSPGEFCPSMVVKYYIFDEGHQPTMVDLAIAAFVAHDYDSVYSLFLCQCYWYADVVCAVLENIVGRDHYKEVIKEDEEILLKVDVFLGESDIQALRPVSNGALNERIQAIEPLRVDQWSKLKQGYNFVKINTRQPHVVTSLRREFDKVKRSFADKDARRIAQEQLHSQNEELQRQVKDKDRLQSQNEELQRQVKDKDRLKSQNEELQRQVKDKDRLLEEKNKELEELRALRARFATQTSGGPSNQL